MTRESRHFIGIEEILGIEYECPKCHGRIYYALDNVPYSLFTCRGCGSDAVGDGSDGQWMDQVIKAIKYLQSRGDSVNRFRFQITGEKV